MIGIIWQVSFTIFKPVLVSLEALQFLQHRLQNSMTGNRVLLLVSKNKVLRV